MVNNQWFVSIKKSFLCYKVAKCHIISRGWQWHFWAVLHTRTVLRLLYKAYISCSVPISLQGDNVVTYLEYSWTEEVKTIETLINTLFSKMRGYIKFKILLLYCRYHGNRNNIKKRSNSSKHKVCAKYPFFARTCTKKVRLLNKLFYEQMFTK